MKRTVITVDGNGRLSIPSNLEDLWMSESELIDMLYITSSNIKYIDNQLVTVIKIQMICKCKYKTI